MKRTSKVTGLALAAAAAAVFATGCSTICGGEEGPVKCAGVNTCKGSSSCATPGNSCKGHNSCKSKGWVYMSKDECLARGGEVVY